MKKFSILSAFFICVLQVNAQITLTSSNIPIVGDSFDYYYQENYPFDVSQSGANQTWDFYSASGTLATINIINPSSSMDQSSFPSANLVGTQTVNAIYTESYFSSSSSDLSLEGNFLPGTFRIIYLDKQEYLKFPITYNDSFNETFAGTLEDLSSSLTYDRTGTAVITADGYGDLILPYTTVHNVLKVKLTYDITDTFMGFPFYSTQVINIWYNMATRFYLASTTEVYSNSVLQSSSASYIDQSDLVLGIDDSSLNVNNILVYPNPASNFFQIKNTSREILTAKIIDISGRNVKTLTINIGDSQIDSSNLRSGVYLITFNKGSDFYTKKLVIK